MGERDLVTLRAVSNYFYRTSGIYARACNYFANMYRFDWYVVPEVYDKKVKEDKVVTDFVSTLQFLDNSSVKKISADISLKTIIEGACYVYAVMNNDKISI